VRAVLVGPPGAGKGTQAKLIADHFGIAAISTGNIFRAHVKQDTELGRSATRYLDAGELVPDSVTNAMVAQRLSRPDVESGFLLDGYPRNPAQAEVLDATLSGAGTSLSVVLRLRVEHEELVRRLSQRVVCAGCGDIAQVAAVAVESGACGTCSGSLSRRSDDRPDTVRRRLEVYASETAPLLDYYDSRGILVDVDGEGEVDQVVGRAVQAMATPALR
jgi:adenylate kinase